MVVVGDTIFEFGSGIRYGAGCWASTWTANMGKMENTTIKYNSRRFFMILNTCWHVIEIDNLRVHFAGRQITCRNPVFGPPIDQMKSGITRNLDFLRSYELQQCRLACACLLDAAPDRRDDRGYLRHP